MNARLHMIPGFGAFVVATTLSAAPDPAKTQASATYASLPLSFEANLGQADPTARFVWHGRGCSLMLTGSGAVLRVEDETLRMQLTGARRSPEVIGVEELPGRVNYFVGNDPLEWRTNIPTYSKVKYRDVYPGIDLVYYGTGKQLEYDFIVAPGADPDLIRLTFDGAASLRVDSAGDLRFRLQTAEIRLRRPVVYQQTAAGRRILEAKYSLSGGDQIAFHVANHDPSQALVIDPVLDFASYLGGSGAEGATAVAVDKSGNVYLTGNAYGVRGFPVVNPLPGSSDWKGAFVAKMNPAGTSLLYSTYLGDRMGRSSAAGIAVDAAGNAYVTGVTAALDFPTTKGALQVDSGGGSDIWGFGPNSDAFITKLNATGSALVYSTYLGGRGNDLASAIAVDGAGNAIVAGRTDPNPGGAYISSDKESAFVAKINTAGSALVYMTNLAGSREDWATAVATDGQGNAYATGATYSPDFPARNAFQPRPAVAVAYRSTDAGKVWIPSDSGLPTGVSMLVIDPQTPSTIYAAGDRGVAKSIDGGDNWKLVNNGIQNLGIISLLIDPGAPATLYAIAFGGGLLDSPGAFYRTTNGGANWTPLPSPLPDGPAQPSGPTSLAIDPGNSAILYLGTSQGVFKSTDAGAHWSAAGLTGYVARLVVDPRNSTTIYAVSSVNVNGDYRQRILKSVDGSDNWVELPLVVSYSLNIAIDPTDSAVLYANSAQGIEKTVDGGASWKVVLRSASLLALAGGGTGAVLYASNADGILASTDSGATWTPTSFRRGSVAVLAVDPSRPATLYIGLGGLPLQAFAAKLNPSGSLIYSTYLGGNGGNEGRAIAVDSQGNAYVTGWTNSPDFPGVAAGRAPRDDPSEVFAAKISTDGTHLLWATTFGGGGADIGQAIAVDIGGNAYIAGSTESGDFPIRAAVQDSAGGPALVHSTDGGFTWSRTGKNFPGTDVRVLATDASSEVIYAGGNRGVFVSRDGGSSWAATGLAIATTLLAIDPRTPSTLYAAAVGRALFQSTDGGQTWRPINTGLPTADIRALVIDPATPTTLYCATDTEIFKTIDSGRNWMAIGPGGGNILALAIDAADPSRIFAMRFTDSNTEVLAGDDGGASWRILWQNSNAYSALEGGNGLVPDPRGSSTIHALVWGAVFTSNDSGANWRPLLPEGSCMINSLALSPDNPSALYAGGANYNGRSCLFQTPDGGQTWRNQYDGGTGVTALVASRFQPGTVFGAINAGADAFVTKLGPDGATLIYSTYLGGARVDSASAIAIDANGSAWVAGTTQSTDFPLANPLQPRFGGDPDNGMGYPGTDAFVVKLNEKSGQ